jgi:hypothetical protein
MTQGPVSLSNVSGADDARMRTTRGSARHSKTQVSTITRRWKSRRRTIPRIKTQDYYPTLEKQENKGRATRGSAYQDPEHIPLTRCGLQRVARDRETYLTTERTL